MDNATYLVIGACGTGKTWIMKQLIASLNIKEAGQCGLYHMVRNEDKKVIVLGKYDGSMFEGSDRLAMNIMADNYKFINLFANCNYTLIAEGDRFTNNTFIKDFNPTILRVNGNGKEGRIKRGSEQTERHLKSIATRVKNIQSDYEFEDSSECFDWLLKTLLEPDRQHFAQISKKKITQNSLF